MGKRNFAYSLAEIIVASFLLLLILGIVAGGMWSQSKSFQTTIEGNKLKAQCFNAIDTISGDMRGCKIPVNYYCGIHGHGGSLAVATAGEVKLQIGNSKNQVITYQLYRGELQRVVTDLGNSANNGTYTLATNVGTCAFDPLSSGDELKAVLWNLSIGLSKSGVSFPTGGHPMEVKIAVRVGEYAAEIPIRISTKTTTTTSAFTVDDIMWWLSSWVDHRHSWHGGTYDCWGLSNLEWVAFETHGINARIIQFATSYSSNHRQVQVWVGWWMNVDPTNYGFDWLFRTRSVPGRFRVIQD